MGNPRGMGEDLHSVAREGDLSMVKSILISDPLAINSRDKHSRTPHFGKRLHLAAWSGNAEVVSYLCKQNADVGAAAMDDMGAIHFAAQKGHLEIVRILLSSGASIKASTRKGFTALHYAVQGSHLELVKYLIKKGANLSSKTKARKTPLDLASNEEIRSCLEECENASKKCDLNGKPKAEESDPKQSVPGEEKYNSKQYVTEEVESNHDPIKATCEPESGSSKRRDDVKEAYPAPRKAKISKSSSKRKFKEEGWC